MVPVTRVDADTLSQFEGFANVPQAKLVPMAAAMSVWRFQRRERIFTRNEAARNLYILLSGAAKLSGFNKAQEPVLVTLMPPGETFGISALLPAAVHQFQCDAFTDCVLARIDAQQFVRITLGVSLLDFRTVMGISASQLMDLLTRYLTMLRLPVPDRLLTAFAELSFKFGTRHEQGTLLAIPLTHQDLADLVGATRQVITLHLRDMERDGAIIRERRRLILVPGRMSSAGAIDPPEEAFMPRAVPPGTAKGEAMAIGRPPRAVGKLPPQRRQTIT